MFQVGAIEIVKSDKYEKMDFDENEYDGDETIDEDVNENKYEVFYDKNKCEGDEIFKEEEDM